MTAHPLDNPVWGSISGVHRDLGTVDGGAGVYHPDVCPFAGIEDPADPKAWNALAEILGGHATCLLVDPGAAPHDWEIITVIPGVQMDGSALDPAEDEEAIVLTAEDVPEMLALVERTQPGPYRARTIEMGQYLGIRRDGDLIAMAGERLRPPGWTEISAVCTDAHCRGEGLGTRLVRAVAAGVRARNEVPFLHAAADNTTAIHLYETLGFTVRRTGSFTILRQQRRSE